MSVAGAGRRVFVSLGSNVGDRRQFLAMARRALAGLPDTRLVATSQIYETEPQDLATQPDYLNQVVCVETGLEPLALLRATQDIEAAAGRVRNTRFGPRTLDIDILLFEGVESETPELTIPHPRMTHRAFVLAPLAEVWDLARGMPAIPVGELARHVSLAQKVRRAPVTKVDP